MAQILIKGGRVIDPSRRLDTVTDLLIENEKIAAIAPNQSASPDALVFHARGLIVAPGLIDMHVHLREPGDEEEETIASGADAALAGGFTSVVCMPNTDPPIDNEATIDFVYRQAAAARKANVFPTGAITKNRHGKELAEMGQMVRGGAVAFTDDGDGVQNPAVLLRALKYAHMFDKPILQHCQDANLSANGVMNSGYWATVLGLPGMSPLAEECMLHRDVQLAKQAGARYHAQHLSTRGSVEIIRRAKTEGALVTAEVTPHHLLLSEDRCRAYDTHYKMNPPLRSFVDCDALRQGLADGTIDCLVTDHAPHLQSEKELEFLYAPFGIISLECALGLFVKALIDPGILDWPHLLALLTINPARILGLPKGTLAPGADADVTLIDPFIKHAVNVDTFHSKSRNCPYHGWQLTARPVATLVAGEIRYQAPSFALQPTSPEPANTP